MTINFPNAALLVIDVQYDFCPAGALGVEEGDQVIEPLNRLAALFAAKAGRIIATQDWHPAGHASFASFHGKNPGEIVDLPGLKGQYLWPDHCIQGSRGADFHEALDMRQPTLIIRKGFRQNLDSYSAFFENDRITSTGLDGFLKSLSINTLVLGGLATDYCVLYSALDARTLGYNTIIAEDAVRGVGLPPGSVEEAYRLLKGAGVTFAKSGDIQ